MLTLNFQNLTKLNLNPDFFSPDQTEFETLKQNIISRDQGFLNLLPEQTDKDLKKIIDFSAKIEDKFDFIVILGIGGSMLGPQTILQALDDRLARYNQNREKKPTVLTVDNSDPDVIRNVELQIVPENTLFLVQTKSGSTAETLSQFFYFSDILQKKGIPLRDNFVFVTDPKNGYLRELAKKEGVPSFIVPPNVGGRFSVLSDIGLLVAGLVGLDIKEMIRGSKKAKTEFFDKSSQEAYQLAKLQYHLFQHGKNISVLMPYSSRLKTLGAWYTQLLAESIGKELNLEGEKVNVGITPVNSLGATDQHSLLQLLKEGPNDKLTIFLEVEKFETEIKIPVWDRETNKFDYLNQKDVSELILAELSGTRQSLTESDKPNLTLKIAEVNEYYLGQLFFFFELSVAFLGEIFGIDTFDQPGVERSKEISKELLSI